jgi:hypothetical protein
LTGAHAVVGEARILEGDQRIQVGGNGAAQAEFGGRWHARSLAGRGGLRCAADRGPAPAADVPAHSLNCACTMRCRCGDGNLAHVPRSQPCVTLAPLANLTLRPVMPDPDSVAAAADRVAARFAS